MISIWNSSGNYVGSTHLWSSEYLRALSWTLCCSLYSIIFISTSTRFQFYDIWEKTDTPFNIFCLLFCKPTFSYLFMHVCVHACVCACLHACVRRCRNQNSLDNLHKNLFTHSRIQACTEENVHGHVFWKL